MGWKRRRRREKKVERRAISWGVLEGVLMKVCVCRGREEEASERRVRE